MVKNSYFIIIVLIFSFIASFSLLHKGLIPTHDGEYHVVRFHEFTKVIKDGDWYPRFAPDFNYGFGIPLFNYVYPLPNYVAYFLHLFGTSFIDAFKLNMFLAVLIGGAFFYMWSLIFWGKIGGLVSSIFYTYSPYHFVDMYIRGSVGEVWALAFFPAFLWSITEFIIKKKQKYFILSSIFLCLIIFSHNILALMFFAFSITYTVLLILMNKDYKYLILNVFYIVLIGLGLSSIFWLPALFEEKYVTGLRIFDISSHFPDLYQLLIPTWGSGFSGTIFSNQLSFQIGIANLLAVLISVFVLIRSFKRDNRTFRILFFLLLWFILIFFLMLKISLPIWQKIPLMNYFQFPWRLLSLETLLASFLAGSIFAFLRNKLFAIIMIAIVFLLGIGYFKPAYYLSRDDSYYISRSNFMDGTNSPGNTFNTVWGKTDLHREKDKIKFIKNKGKVLEQNIKSTKYIFKVYSEINTDIVLNTVYFPGWKFSIDKKSFVDVKNSDGIISFSIPQGEHIIEVKFTDTKIRTISQLFFWSSLVAIFSLLLKGYFVRIKQ